MKALALLFTLALQVPSGPYIRVAPPPPPSVPEARASLLGLRIIDVRGDGAYLLGSACPIGAFAAYTALHVIDAAKGQLVALPTHGYQGDARTSSRLRVIWKDEKKDLALVVPEDSEQAFLYWYQVVPVPKMGAPVAGTLMLPTEGNIAVPVFGTYYGPGDGWHWTSLNIGPGSSGSCALDAEGRAWGIMSQTASWGNEGMSPDNRPRASIAVEIPKKP